MTNKDYGGAGQRPFNIGGTETIGLPPAAQREQSPAEARQTYTPDFPRPAAPMLVPTLQPSARMLTIPANIANGANNFPVPLPKDGDTVTVYVAALAAAGFSFGFGTATIPAPAAPFAFTLPKLGGLELAFSNATGGIIAVRVFVCKGVAAPVFSVLA